METNLFALTTLTCNNRLTLFPVIQSVFRNCTWPKGTFWFIVLQGCSAEHVAQVVKTFRECMGGSRCQVKEFGASHTVIFNTRICVHLLCIPENLGLSKGNNVLAVAARSFKYVMFVEDDWYALPEEITHVVPNWVSACLSFLETNPTVSSLFLRKYATEAEKFQYGWTRQIGYVCHRFAENFNYAANMKNSKVMTHDGIKFQHIPNCLFTFNPCIRRNKDYYEAGVFPLPEFADVSKRQGQWNATKEGEIHEWGSCEALSMEKTRHLQTFNVAAGLFGHFEDFQTILAERGHL